MEKAISKVAIGVLVGMAAAVTAFCGVWLVGSLALINYAEKSISYVFFLSFLAAILSGGYASSRFTKTNSIAIKYMAACISTLVTVAACMRVTSFSSKGEVMVATALIIAGTVAISLIGAYWGAKKGNVL